MCRYSVFGQGVADIIVVLLGQHFRDFRGAGTGLKTMY